MERREREEGGIDRKETVGVSLDRVVGCLLQNGGRYRDGSVDPTWLCICVCTPAFRAPNESLLSLFHPVFRGALDKIRAFFAGVPLSFDPAPRPQYQGERGR